MPERKGLHISKKQYKFAKINLLLCNPRKTKSELNQKPKAIFQAETKGIKIITKGSS